MSNRTILRQYYKTNHWKDFSRSLLQNKSVVCELCGTEHWKQLENGKWIAATKFNVHHKNYDHLNCESRYDVMVLCEQCHKNLHGDTHRISINANSWKKYIEDDEDEDEE